MQLFLVETIETAEDINMCSEQCSHYKLDDSHGSYCNRFEVSLEEGKRCFFCRNNSFEALEGVRSNRD